MGLGGCQLAHRSCVNLGKSLHLSVSMKTVTPTCRLCKANEKPHVNSLEKYHDG
jgi:predicted transcriptional regulator